MRQVLALAATAILLTGASATADDKENTKAKDDVKVEIKSGGATVIVDDEGKVQVKKFGDVDLDKILENLPKEMREKVKKALKKQDGKEVRSFGFRGIFIGPDGKKHEFGNGDGKFDRKKVLEGLPKEVREKIEKAMKEHGGIPGFRVDGAGQRKVEFKARQSSSALMERNASLNLESRVTSIPKSDSTACLKRFVRRLKGP